VDPIKLVPLANLERSDEEAAQDKKAISAAETNAIPCQVCMS
jgi:hypothetical protein